MSQSHTKLSAIQKQLEYWRAYGMKNDPFDNDNVDGRYFWGEDREELLRRALQLACCATQAVVFYGPKGIGKTKFLQALHARLEDDEQIVVVTVPAGHMTTPQQLFSHLGQAFDLSTEQLEPAEIEVRIKERLQESENGRSKLVILVDDADQLPEFTLASLLVMAHYPDNYISVLLFAATDGIGVLRAELQNSEIEQLAIEPFDAFTLEAYVRYRLDLAGIDRNFPFTQADLASLHKESRGIPNRIDDLARQYLQAALKPRAADAPSAIETRVSLPRIPLPPIKLPHIRLPQLKLPQITLPPLKLPQITLPQLKLPPVMMSWQPLAAVAGLLVFVGGAWLLSGGFEKGQVKPTIAALPAEPGSKGADAAPRVRDTPTAPVKEPVRIAARLAEQWPNQPQTPTRSSSEALALQSPAAEQQWLDRALSLSPAAGKPTADMRVATPLAAALPVTPPRANDASSTAKPTALATESKPASTPVQARLEAVKVKQKYINKARAALPADEIHLLKLPKDSYTLQLLGSSSQKGMRQFVNDNKNIEILVFEEELDGRPWFVAVTGSYASVEQARDGLAELPPALRTLKPWPRQFSSVHEDIKRYRRR